MLPLVLLGLLGVGLVIGIGYAVFRNPEPQPISLVPAPPLNSKPWPETPPVEVPAAEPRTVDSKPADPKPSDTKPIDSKPIAARPTEPASTDTQPKNAVPVVAPDASKPKPTTAEAPRGGTLVVHAIPFAEAFIDGKSPVEVNGDRRFSLKAGSHTVRLKHPRKDESFTITVNPGQTAELTFRPLQ